MIREIAKQARLASTSAFALAVSIPAALVASGSTAAADSDRPTQVAPDVASDLAREVLYSADATFYRSLGIDVARELSVVKTHLSNIHASERVVTQDNSLSTYETKLPHTTQPPISAFEKAVLVAYLDNPNDTVFSAFLAIYHLKDSLLRPMPAAQQGEGLRHTLLALYFLNRARDTGSTALWPAPAQALAQDAADRVFKSPAPITSDENHTAHLLFRETFHLNGEQNRYAALAALLQDFTRQSKNVYTSFAVTAINLWEGGEADYDDPTTLYNFVLGSYFSLHTIELAHQLESAWNQHPESVTRFRMAATLGGFSLLQRRWLATLHRDQEAVALIDDEHRLWRAIQPAFHAFTFGLPFFEEQEHFAEGYSGYAAGLGFCQAVLVRTCSDLPRFHFNVLGYILGFVDFALKAGDLATAKQLMTYNQLPTEVENYAYWDIGRDAWEHRANNLEAIMALYHNDNPSDDPVNFEMKRRKWATDTTTCQECHQTQARPQTIADINAPQMLPPAQVASVGAWPPVTTTWYGSTLNP